MRLRFLVFGEAMLLFFIRFSVSVFSLGYFSIASAQTIGSWTVQLKLNDAIYAATVNDSGALLGQFCFLNETSCVWMLRVSSRCNKGNKYPALANSDAGASWLELVCYEKIDGGQYFVFSNFDALEGIVKNGTRIGIALPLQEDQFRVIRFRLNGAKQAVDLIREFNAKRVSPARGGVHDQLL